MLTIQALEAFARAKGDEVAIESDSGGTTWKELLNSVTNKVDGILQKFSGKIPGRACFLSENGPNLVAWLGAFATLGTVVTGLDHTADPEAVRSTIARLHPDLLLCSEHMRSSAWFRGRPKAFSINFFDPFVVGDHQPMGAVRLEGIKKPPFCSISVTSGTSGKPKLVFRNESFDKRRFAFFSNRFRFDARDRFLACVPIYHAAGNGWVRYFLSLGARIVLTDKSDGKSLADALYRKGITATVLTPVLLDKMLDSLLDQGCTVKPKELRWVLVGGKNFTPHQKRRSIEVLGPVHEYYGTTETGVNTLADPIDLLLHPRSVGRTFEGNEIVIVGPSGNALAPGEVGAVAVASYMNMAYYGEEPTNEIVIGGMRYLITPDQGYLDEDGRLYLRNRLSRPDAIADLYGLEDEIRQISSVRDVIFHQGMADRANEVSCAVVATDSRNGMESKVRSLVEKTGLRLTSFAAVDDIPYSPTGKVRVGFFENAVNAERSLL